MLFPFKGKYTPPAEDPPAKRARTDQQDALLSSSGLQTTTGTIYSLAESSKFYFNPFRQFVEVPSK